jgi:hypothetical protein
MTGPDAEFAIASTQMLLPVARLAVGAVVLLGAALILMAAAWCIARLARAGAFIRFLERLH